ncbi:hypothetical protein Ahy_A05g021920 isoform K [Arachis hypogaea]|uniref:Uncharacterized protein n=1 Tax=Arachis hypogaea TaxID=3818 RepID=A0A445CYZ9_ARAHY|nr:hypothetical protein Ahy_A05g021920 isoform K [Arachis hypogaea]
MRIMWPRLLILVYQDQGHVSMKLM